ncbi:MAG TPA: hypothetical protein VHX88_01135 [Solirubrobacteraceae bacterium]|jgi:hypothetical protein|nr:hypothetical protein [Solirubrobacteraceae bacterium]
MAAVSLPPDALALLAALDAASVDHVMIGELAAAVHGQPWANDTLVITPARYGRNLDRLSRLLRDLDAAWRVEGEVEVLDVDLCASELMRVDRWRLLTDQGELDLEFAPGGLGYRELFRDARPFALGGTVVQVLLAFTAIAGRS